MSKPSDTLDKAYGNVPSHLPNEYNMWDWIPTVRGARYTYIMFWRKLFR